MLGPTHRDPKAVFNAPSIQWRDVNASRIELPGGSKGKESVPQLPFIGVNLIVVEIGSEKQLNFTLGGLAQ